MYNDNTKLRIEIRNILEQYYTLSEKRVNQNQNNGSALDWVRFEYFGWYALKNANYQGDKQQVLNATKKELETREGWKFHDPLAGII